MGLLDGSSCSSRAKETQVGPVRLCRRLSIQLLSCNMVPIGRYKSVETATTTIWGHLTIVRWGRFTIVTLTKALLAK